MHIGKLVPVRGDFDGTWVHALPTKHGVSFSEDHLEAVPLLFKSKHSKALGVLSKENNPLVVVSDNQFEDSVSEEEDGQGNISLPAAKTRLGDSVDVSQLVEP